MKKKFVVFFKEILNKKFLVSIAGMMLCQSIVFFLIKFFQSDYHYIYCTVDNKIPFVPEFVYIYNIFYPFVFITLYYVFCKDRKSYYNGIIAGTIGYLISDVIFLIYPTIMSRPDIVNADYITRLVVKITYLADEPALNCLPSIHCLFCYQAMFTTIISKGISNLKKTFICIVLFLIVISTLLVKQHYFYDTIGALIVFIISNMIVYEFKLYPKIVAFINSKKKKKR